MRLPIKSLHISSATIMLLVALSGCGIPSLMSGNSVTRTCATPFLPPMRSTAAAIILSPTPAGIAAGTGPLALAALRELPTNTRVVAISATDGDRDGLRPAELGAGEIPQPPAPPLVHVAPLPAGRTTAYAWDNMCRAAQQTDSGRIAGWTAAGHRLVAAWLTRFLRQTAATARQRAHHEASNQEPFPLASVLARAAAFMGTPPVTNSHVVIWIAAPAINLAAQITGVLPAGTIVEITGIGIAQLSSLNSALRRAATDPLLFPGEPSLSQLNAQRL